MFRIEAQFGPQVAVGVRSIALVWEDGDLPADGLVALLVDRFMAAGESVVKTADPEPVAPDRCRRTACAHPYADHRGYSGRRACEVCSDDTKCQSYVPPISLTTVVEAP